ncbi:helix-turn-helix domain-containing protein [Ruminococcaceae bacterium OttesenSCG-928-L11]|nr:helix-turn-helix domain-containing protein [Ruminococcaceae bacterium OttesenSCG-928-L11]
MRSGLIRRAKSGDATAMEEIVKLHYDDIYHFLCRKLARNVTRISF